MNKDIKDYLHLYLGCEVMTNNIDGESSKGYLTGFTGMDEQNVEVQLHDGIHADEEPIYKTYDEVKPILRPLSDMTEEEAIELAKLSEWEPHFRDVKTYRNQFNDIIVHWDGMCETREEFNATGELFYCSEQFQWLLKKGFDLFELILEGLAIDKTKITDHGKQ